MRITSRFHRYRVALVGILLVSIAAGSSVLNGTPIAAAASCDVTYTVTWANEQSFTADVKIRNNGATVNGWTLAWTFPGNQSVSNAWNTALTQSGANVAAQDANWNGSIPTGGTAGFGFNANFSGANDRPTNFTLNGVACGSSSSPTSTPAATPTSTPSKTPTPTAAAPVVTASVTPSATDVAVGDTIVVRATSNLGIPQYTLTVIDASTGAVQDQANPIFTPAQPAPISVSSGGVSWTLQAVRAGTVRFAVRVNGETFDPRCNCFFFTNASAMSALVTVRAAATPTSTPTRTPTPASCSVLVTVLSQWNGGFQDQVKITNTGTTTTNGWIVTWRFSGNQTISSLAGGIYTQNGQNITVRNQSRNGRLDPGRSATFSFVATGSASGALTNLTCTLIP
jgi:cellulase/cellobiase CelA1